MKKRLFKPVKMICIIIFVLITTSQSTVENTQEKMEIGWIKTENLSNLDEGIRINVDNQLDSIFESFSGHYKNYNSFSSSEKNYYFKDNQAVLENDTDDFITVKDAKGKGNAYSMVSICNPDNPYDCNLTQRAYKASAYHSMTLTMDKANTYLEENIVESGLWNTKHKLYYGFFPCGEYWYGTKYCWMEKKTSSSNPSKEVIINNLHQHDNGNPVISINNFLRSPDFTFNLSKSHYWGAGAPFKRIDWRNTKKEIYMYRAKSPAPSTYNNNFSSIKSIHNNTLNDNNNTIGQVDIFMRPEGYDNVGVKIFIAQFYEITGENTYSLLTNKNIYKDIQTEGNEIKNVSIKGSHFEDLKDGNYLMLIGIIDKFNKKYFYQPQYFTIDNTKPEITQIENTPIITEKKYFNENDAEAVIMQWENMSDNLTDYYADGENIFDYIYINNGLWTGAKPVTDIYFDNYLVLDQDNKQIKLKDECELRIKDLYIRDKADNRYYLIKNNDNKMFISDYTKPEVKLQDPDALTKEYKYNDAISIEIWEKYNITIEEIKIIIDGTEYIPGYFHFPAYYSDLLIVQLNHIKNNEGNFTVKLIVKDEAGNINTDNEGNLWNEYVFTSDNKSPIITAKIGNKDINDFFIDEFNGEVELQVNVDDQNYNNTEILFQSNSLLRNKQVNITESEYIMNLKKEEDVSIEKIKITIKAYDNNGSMTKLDHITIHLYDDISPPQITAMNEETWKYKLNITDESVIDKIYIKQIDIKADLTLEDFIPDPPGNEWEELTGNLKIIDKDIDVLPQKAVCIIAIDKWGNGSINDGVILKNNQFSSIIINNKDELRDIYNWELYGDVLIRTDITIESGEVLNIITKNNNPTTIDFDSTIGQLKLINNGGTINIDSTDNNITFKGIGESDNDYKWFGIQNKTGELLFTGSNKVYFESAVSPISYKYPDINISLANLELNNSFMGIHFIDQGASYNNLNIDNITFNNLIYAVKFDLDSYENEDIYINASNHLTYSNCTANNIIKGHLYCPVEGLSKLESFNTAPLAENVSISGTYKSGETISGSYTYYDEDNDPENGTKYQWYISNSKSGPYSKIDTAVDIDFTIPNLNYAGKWLKFKVSPSDDKGALGNGVYSESVQVDNTAPAASDVSISGTPRVLYTLKGEYTFTDADGDQEGNSEYQWYISDTENGDFVEIENADRLTWHVSSVDHKLKWIKFSVTPIDSAGKKGETVLSPAVQISDILSPIAQNIIINGTLIPGNTLTGYYEYLDPNGLNESGTLYNWYYSNEKEGSFELIGVTDINLIIHTFLSGKWIKLEITPKNEIGIVGEPTLSEPVEIGYLPPYTENVTITGNPDPGQTLEAYYDFYDPASLEEGDSTYKWYYSDSTDDNSFIELEGEKNKTLNLTNNHEGYYVRFSITPKNTVGIEGETKTSNYIFINFYGDLEYITEFESEYLSSPRGITQSPDGNHLYVVDYSKHNITWYNRNKTTGLIEQIGLYTINKNYIKSLVDVKISPDGEYVYALRSSVWLNWFKRDLNNGNLVYKNNFTDTSGFYNETVMELSNDGNFLYVGGQYYGTNLDQGYLKTFLVNKENGSLDYLGKKYFTEDSFSVFQIKFTNNEKFAYITTRNGLSQFSYNKTNGNLELIKEYQNIFPKIDISPDDKYLYEVKENYISSYKIDEETGNIELIETKYNENIVRPNFISISPDNQNLYITTSGDMQKYGDDGEILFFKLYNLNGTTNYIGKYKYDDNTNSNHHLSKISISSDGKYIYVIGVYGKILLFKRNLQY